MTEDLENKIQEQRSEQYQDNESGREGYERNSDYQNDYREENSRSQRPRIHTQRAYSSDRNNNMQDRGGFRPEGFGANLQSGSGEQGRPSYNNYQPRGGYQPRQGGYQSRGYQQREGGYQQRDGGYQQRPNNYNRPRYNNNDGGYQQREGYQPREGYQSRTGGYRPRQGGYDRQQGGYQPRQSGYGRQQGGYQPRPGGYGRQQGGYQPRQGGYNRYQGGYDRRPGGYVPRQGYDPDAKYSMKKRIEYKEEHIDPNEPIRLNRYLANAGVCSRREADEFIQAGVVAVNGEIVTELGTKVLRSDEVKFRDQLVTLEKKVYVLLNKPKDYVTTSDDPQQRKTVMDLVKGACPERIYPVGRLDRNTTGVLLLTNDGDLASKLTHPKFLKKKVYHVFLDKNVPVEDLQKIAEGVELEDGEVHADAIEYVDECEKTQVGIEIHSGKNRIVRRIFEALGYRVIRLDRVQFAGLTKKNVRRGDWRFLTEQEVDMLRSGMYE